MLSSILLYKGQACAMMPSILLYKSPSKSMGLWSRTNNHEMEGFLALVVAWICTSAFSYGYHISALNALSDVITCAYKGSQSIIETPLGLPECVRMTDAEFGLLTASYTVGGFIGALLAGRLADSRGRKAAILYSAWAVAGGDALMTVALNLYMLIIGRTVIGLGSGAATVIVPLYLSEIAPASIRGSIGILNQVSITIGLFVAVALGLPLARPSSWRFVPVVSAAFSTLQLVFAPLMPESPVWLKNAQAGQTNSSDDTENSLSTSEDTAADVEDAGAPLLAQNQHRQPMSFGEMLSSPDPGLRRGLAVIAIAMLAQQLSGINAVFYFSTKILGAILPTQAGYISLFLAFANVIIGLAPVFLIERLGRRTLLLCSLLGITISSFVLGVAINHSVGSLASIFILGHVASFAVGAGPVPFVLIGEVVPSYASGSAGSLGLGVCWSASFVIGIGFLPLQEYLSRGTREGQGNIFFGFGIITSFFLLVLSRLYRG